MEIVLDLGSTGFKAFVKQFREAGLRSAPGTDLVVVVKDTGRRFFFRTPNWELHGYQDPGGEPMEFNRYNYPDPLRDTPLTSDSIRTAFNSAYGFVIDQNLALVLFVTSESARSVLMYQLIQDLIDNPNRANGLTLSNGTILIKNFGRVCEFVGYTRGGQFLSSWRPLQYADYERTFFADSGGVKSLEISQLERIRSFLK